MKNTLTKGKNRIGPKHYLWLLLWWLSLSLVIKTNSSTIGLAFLTLFFLATTGKKLKAIAIAMVIAAVIGLIFPMVLPLLGIAAALFLLLKISFVIKNWRPLLVGAYAYGVYALIMIFLKTKAFAAYLFSLFLSERLPSTIEQMQGVTATGQGPDFFLLYHYSPFIIAGFLALILDLLIRWLYRKNYDTDTAFAIMGMTPLVFIGFIIPLIKYFHANGFSLKTLATNADASDVVESVKDMLPHSEKTVAAKNIGDLIPDSVSDMVSDAADHIMSESTIDTVSDTVKNLADDSLAKVVANSVSDTVSHSVADAVSDSFANAAHNDIHGLVTDAVREPVANLVRDSVEEMVPDSVKGAVRDSAKNLAPHLPQYTPAIKSFISDMQNAQSIDEAVISAIGDIPEPVQAAAATGAATSAFALDDKSKESELATVHS